MTEKKIDTLGDALPREMTRVRDEVLPAYMEVGGPAMGAIFLMRETLDLAQRALAEGDVVAMARIYEDLKGFKL